jgi:hypothetical protein
VTVPNAGAAGCAAGSVPLSRVSTIPAKAEMRATTATTATSCKRVIPFADTVCVSLTHGITSVGLMDAERSGPLVPRLR